MPTQGSPEGEKPPKRKLSVLSVLKGIKRHKAVQKTQLDRAARITELLGNGTIQLGASQNKRAERITDPEYAPQMHEHRETQLCADFTARSLYAVMHASSPEEKQQMLDRLTKYLSEAGGLFSTYTTAEDRARIEKQQEYVCVRAGAQFLNPESHDWDEFQFTSEMRTRLASEDPQAPLIVPIPDPDSASMYRMPDENGDMDRGVRIAESIHNNHAQIAEIEDVYTYVETAKKHGTASLARNETDRIIEEVINPSRSSEAQIRYIIANMFRLKGMRILSGDADNNAIELEPSIRNENSIKMHAMTSNKRFKAVVGWDIEPKPMPVSFAPEGSSETLDAELDMGWVTVVLERQRP